MNNIAPITPSTTKRQSKTLFLLGTFICTVLVFVSANYIVVGPALAGFFGGLFAVNRREGLKIGLYGSFIPVLFWGTLLVGLLVMAAGSSLFGKEFFSWAFGGRETLGIAAIFLFQLPIFTTLGGFVSGCLVYKFRGGAVTKESSRNAPPAPSP